MYATGGKGHRKANSLPRMNSVNYGSDGENQGMQTHRKTFGIIPTLHK